LTLPDGESDRGARTGSRIPSTGTLVAIAVAGVSLGFFVPTLLPGIAFGDWGEMQTVPHVLGIAHPTGYPTYILLAAMVEAIPVGAVAFRGNLLSAILIALALAVTVSALVRMGVRPSIAGPLALALGLTVHVWEAALAAEANPLHLLLVALLVHRALVWSERHATRDLVIGGLLIGLAFGNHLLTVTAAPFLAASVVWTGRAAIRARPWIVGAAALATVAGLAVYLYLPLRAAQDPPLAYNHPDTLEGVLDLVTGSQFQVKFGFLRGEGPGELVRALGSVWDSLASAATPIIPLVGAIGLVLLAWRNWPLGLALIAMLLGTLYVYATYEQLEHYLLVPLLVLAIGSAYALETGAQMVARRPGGPDRGGVSLAAAGAAVVLVAVLATGNWTAVDRSSDRRGEDYVEDVFGLLPGNAALLSYWHVTTPLWYSQLVDGRRTDVLIVDDSNIVYDGWETRERAIAQLICERPVFIVRPSDVELTPVRAAYALRFLTSAKVAASGPSATILRPIYEVLPPPGACTGG
jgi:hypothetical protein